MKGSEWLDRYDNDDEQNDNHYELRYFYRELYDYENLINWLRRNNDIEERKVLYQVLFQIICHFEDKQYNNISYGDGFGFSLLDYVNDLFFNEELESETSDDEDLSDGESVGSYE